MTLPLGLLLPTLQWNATLHDMFHLPVPLLEKVLRPVLVYLFLVGFLRLFGKRELAQLNPFDLVVLLSLANTVQNAIIGDDNSVTGGIVGAFALLAINWALVKLLFRAPKLTSRLEGQPTVLIRNGQVDEQALRAETLSQEDLAAVLNRNGFSFAAEVELCVLEPNGTFYVKARSPSGEQMERTEMLTQLKALAAEVRQLRTALESSNRLPS